MELPMQKLLDAGEWLEMSTSGLQRWQLVAGTATATLAAISLLDLINNWRDYSTEAKKEVFRLIRRIPSVKKKIDEELSTLAEGATKSIFKYNEEDEDFAYVTKLPVKGWAPEKIERVAKKVINTGEFNWQSGKISGGAFSGNNASYTSMMAKIFHTTVWTNPLHNDIFPGARKMDAEIVAMTKQILNAHEYCVGCVTTGGSESLMLMMKAYRDFARKQKGITKPEVVAAKTIHAAADKAAHYLGIKLRKVDVDSVTFKANVEQMKQAINSNTILLMASATDFSYGVIDDVEAIAALGLRYDVSVHVDCCMGGFLLPFMEDAGYPLPPFDFRVKGVTSMSADNHKYGNSPKGTSVVVYTSKQLLHAQYFTVPNWPGGIYATPTVAGSRAGVNLAVCWAAMLYHGRSGYVDLTRKIITNARKLKEQVASIPELKVMGDPLGAIIAMQSDVVNMLSLHDLMHEKGWHLIALQDPPGLQICLTGLHTESDFVVQLIKDLRSTVQELLVNPGQETTGIGHIYGMAIQVPDKTLVADIAKLYLDSYYDTPDA